MTNEEIAECIVAAIQAERDAAKPPAGHVRLPDGTDVNIAMESGRLEVIEKKLAVVCDLIARLAALPPVDAAVVRSWPWNETNTAPAEAAKEAK